jgi:hypothetical protein
MFRGLDFDAMTLGDVQLLSANLPQMDACWHKGLPKRTSPAGLRLVLRTHGFNSADDTVSK